jgi:hypothetical protein
MSAARSISRMVSRQSICALTSLCAAAKPARASRAPSGPPRAVLHLEGFAVEKLPDGTASGHEVELARDARAEALRVSVGPNWHPEA